MNKIPRRVDCNQQEIVKVLRKMCCKVHVTSDLGNGFPDLVVSTSDGKLWLVEIKDGKKSTSFQKLTPKEKEFHELWKENVVIINSVDQAILFANRELRI